MEERLGEILNWLKLTFLLDYVPPELRKLLLEKLKKMLDKEWDGSATSVESLKIAIGKKDYKSASGSVRKKIDNGDIENWDLTAVSHVLRALNRKWVSVEEKERMEAAVKIRNHLAHHPSKVILQEEFREKWQKLIDILSFLNVPTAPIEEEIQSRTSDLSSLSSPSVSNAEANKRKEEGNTAFRNADYAQAIEKFDDALKVVSLKEAERGVLFANRSAAYLQMAKAKQDQERKHFAKRAENDAKKAAHLQPMWDKAHFRLGEAYKLLEKFEKAITAYDEALSLDPSLKFVQTRRDECRQGLIDSSIFSYMDHMDMHPLNIDTMIEQITQNQKAKITKELQEEYVGCLKKSGNALADVVEDTSYRFGIDVVVDFEVAASNFSRAANEGNARGIYVLARLTKKGLGVKKDYRRAFQLFDQAANMPRFLHNGLPNEGVLPAMHCLAMMYFEGVGVDTDYAMAFHWHKCAADLGFGPSAYNLACMYTIGWGISAKNGVKAAQYWKLAAQGKNARAMHSLAVHYLHTVDVGRARKWFEFAVEGGEIIPMSIQQNFEATCKAEEERTSLDMAEVENWEQETNLPSSKLSDEDRVDRFVYFNVHRHFPEPSPIAFEAFYNYKTKYELVEEYADLNDRDYAQQVLEAIGNRNLAVSDLYSYKESQDAKVDDSIITRAALCFEKAAYVFPLVDEHRTLLMEIVKKKLSEMKDQICEMDRYARMCDARLQMNSGEVNFKFVKECIRKYPTVAFFHEVLVSMHWHSKLYDEGIELAQKGLDLFPNNLELMAAKAFMTRFAFEGNHADKENVIDCFKVFIVYAPANHRFVPISYYSMAIITLDESLKKDFPPIDGAVRTYYEKGLESEKQLLPCFLPYEDITQVKGTIRDYFETTARVLEEKTNFPWGPVRKEIPMSKIDRLTDPVRVQTILMHRGFRFAKRDIASATAVPQRYVQRAPSCASNVLKSITISEMNPMVDKVYEGHIIDVTIIDDPAAPSAFYVACVVKDTRGDVMLGFFYNVEGDRSIKFGAKVSIQQPYFNTHANNQRPIIRVDDPKSLTFHKADYSERPCQSCGERNAPLTCPDCKKAAYCSEDCQTHDREILQHKLICDL